jgi:hypothetical protein
VSVQPDEPERVAADLRVLRDRVEALQDLAADDAHQAPAVAVELMLARTALDAVTESPSTFQPGAVRSFLESARGHVRAAKDVAIGQHIHEGLATVDDWCGRLIGHEALVVRVDSGGDER